MSATIGMSDRDQEFANWLNERTADGETNVSGADPSHLFSTAHIATDFGGNSVARCESGIGTYEAYMLNSEWVPRKTAADEKRKLRARLAVLDKEAAAIRARLDEMAHA